MGNSGDCRRGNKQKFDMKFNYELEEIFIHYEAMDAARDNAEVLSNNIQHDNIRKKEGSAMKKVTPYRKVKCAR